MAISEKTRKEVMERDSGNCQFWHNHPVPATEISHKDHQGAGGLPPEHWKNQSPNVAASCHECHLRFSGPGRVYVWDEFLPADVEGMNVGGPVVAEVTMLLTGTNNMDDAYRVMKWDAIQQNMGHMAIRAPNGQLVPEKDLWFYNRWLWKEAKDYAQSLEQVLNQSRLIMWKAAEYLAWFKDHNMAAALEDGSKDVLDVGESFSLSSAQTKRMVRLSKYVEGLDEEARGTLHQLDLDIVDRLRKIPDKELVEVGEWFADLPRAEAWSRFNERYPGKERLIKYRVYPGSYREVEAETDKEAEKKIGIQVGDKLVVIKGGSVIRGVRQEEEKEEK